MIDLKISLRTWLCIVNSELQRLALVDLDPGVVLEAKVLNAEVGRLVNQESCNIFRSINLHLLEIARQNGDGRLVSDTVVCVG